MTIERCDIPTEVVRAAVKAANSHRGSSLDTLYCNGAMAKAAIRAALQAMLDSGMAVEVEMFRWHFEGTNCSNKFGGIPVLAIRLDAERKREEQA